jgi:uncharacterized protein DUF6000
MTADIFQLNSPTSPPEISTLRDVFVRRFYLRLLHGNFTHPREGDGGSLRQEIAAAARTISDEQIERLLNEREWRGRLCAAWFVGLGRRASHVPPIGKLLLASEMVYAGQGYCMALGLIGGEECARLLHAYLKVYLPLNGRVYDQDWAIGALAHIEGAPPVEYLEQGLWRVGKYVMDPAESIENFGEVISYLRQYRMIEVAD